MIIEIKDEESEQVIAVCRDGQWSGDLSVLSRAIHLMVVAIRQGPQEAFRRALEKYPTKPSNGD